MKNKIVSLMTHGRWYSTRDVARLVNEGNRGAWPESFVRVELLALNREGLVTCKTAGSGFRWALVDQSNKLPG
jgi:hypothetical protein